MNRSGPVAALEDNLVTFLLDLGRAGGGEERRDATLAWTIGGSPIDYHNAVVPRGRITDADIALSRTLMRRHKVPGSWHVSDDGPLCDRILAHGFTEGGRETGMAADIAALRPAPSPAAFTEVATLGQLATFTAVLAEGFGEGPHEAAWVGAMYARVGHGPGKPWRHYLGHLDGEPIATATALTTGETCGIYFVFTREVARRQGIGAAITRYALVDSGATLGVLGASAMGEPVYRRLGFEAVCTTRILNSP
jgi:GNAT superfamily N-acetyltransferase